MGRIRTVKPELLTHEDLFNAEKDSGFPLRIAFVGLFTVCDREGRFRWEPNRIKLAVLPYDDVKFDQVLNALLSAGFVKRYEVDGIQYGCIPSFVKHQAINQRESQSMLPSMDGEGVIIPHVQAHAKSSYEYKNIPKSLADTVMARDEGKCVRCSSRRDLTIDHIFPQSIGGTHSLDNLRCLCRSCNSSRPVAGQELIDDLASDGLTLNDMQRMCMHVHAYGEGKGREGKGRGKEGVNTTVPPSGETAEVFSYWQLKMNHPQAKLDAKREKAIRARLKDGYTVGELCEAIDGCLLSPHHMGKNETRTVYDDIELICRDGPKVDKFIKLARQGGQQNELQAYMNDFAEWAATK